uniref:Dihydrolipoyllysine-residue succinyltransferase component of 2-oxoglutarate dehydrogenase complex n=1 Tax=Lygus hesperus TaxID=30085 RepID=A0A0A9W8K6_LYGHE
MPPESFVNLFPDPISRNLIKVFLRTLTSTPLTCDDIPAMVPVSSLTELPSPEHIQKIVEYVKQLWVRPLHVPELFENITHVTVSNWNVKLLQSFHSGEELCDLSTPIADVVFEAPDDGYISEIVAVKGSQVPVDSALAIMVHSAGTKDTPSPPHLSTDPIL